MYELSVGSKVFLLGEYQVLQEGSAFLAVIEPRFKMRVTVGSGKLSKIPQGSPAARYFEQEKEFFQTWDFEFQDPHQGRGGFGASTAQVALLQGFKEGFQSFQSQSQVEFDLRKLHLKYLELAQLSTGTQPSGADLISQFKGGLVELDLKSGRIQKHSWPFHQWQMLIFATGKKQATHEHLTQLNRLNLEKLKNVYQQAMEAFRKGEAKAFAQSMGAYQEALIEQGWLIPENQEILKKINLLPGVVAAKACGAMGADVVMVLVEVEAVIESLRDIETLGLNYIGNLESRTEGFLCKNVSSEKSTDSLTGKVAADSSMTNSMVNSIDAPFKQIEESSNKISFKKSQEDSSPSNNLSSPRAEVL